MKLLGESVVNVGLNGVLSNTTNFEQKVCDEILFPDFEISNFCSNSVINIIDLSEGNINDYEWMFESGTLLETNDNANPNVYFHNPGFYDLSLNVSNDIENEVFSVNVEIIENQMTEVEIIENSSGLVSTREGDEYQWYLDGVKLEGKSERTLTPTLSGNYQVAYNLNDNSCLNRISNKYEIVITNIIEQNNSHDIVFYPNPFQDKFNLSGTERGDVVLIYNSSGKVVTRIISTREEELIVMDKYPSGVYYVIIFKKSSVFTNTMIKLN